MNHRTGYGYIERRIVTALSAGPKSPIELAATIYGATDHDERNALKESVARLRKRSVPIARNIRYVLRYGRPHVDAGEITRSLYSLLRAQPMTVDEIARTLYGNDGEVQRRRVQSVVYRMRRAGVVVDVESVYFLIGSSDSNDEGLR